VHPQLTQEQLEGQSCWPSTVIMTTDDLNKASTFHVSQLTWHMQQQQQLHHKQRVFVYSASNSVYKT